MWACDITTLINATKQSADTPEDSGSEACWLEFCKMRPAAGGHPGSE